MKTKTITNQKAINEQNRTLKTYICYLVFFVYAALLYMIGYTQLGLAHLFWPNSTSYMTYLLVAQSLGLIIATVSLGKVLSKLNIRYIFTGGFFLAAIIMILISQIDKFSSKPAVLIAIFVILSLLFGIVVGPISPLIATYLSAVYSGQKRTSINSVANGIGSIGGGVMPILLAFAFYSNSGNDNFSNVKQFYYVAAVLAIIAGTLGWFVNYKHSDQLLSSKIKKTKIGTVKTQTNYNIWKPLIFIIFMMSAYMVAETISNYMVANYSKASLMGNHTKTNLAQKIATEAVGVFIVATGIMRLVSGLWILPNIKKRYYIMASSIGLIITFSGIIAGGFNQIWSTFLIVILLALSLGSLWPVIYAYAVDTDERRASFIGIVMNVVSMAWIPLTQLIVAAIWIQGQNAYHSSYLLYMTPMIIALIAAIMILVGLFISLPMHKKIKVMHKEAFRNNNK